MSEPGEFPDSLRSSAVPRWSHRDPVECGNPFAPADPRHEAWHTATRDARDALVRIDAELEREPVRPGPDRYPVPLVALAVARFDVWARRSLTIVRSPRALRDYALWLKDYTERWLNYVAETCPKVDVADELRVQLTTRSRYWVDGARRGLFERATDAEP